MTTTPLQKITDGWMNLITGIGSVAKSRMAQTTFQRDTPRTAQELADLFENDALAYRVCSEVPKDMFRRGMEVEIENNESLSDDLTDRLETLEVGPRFVEALSMTRCMGRAGIFLMVDDGRDVRQPINTAAIKAIRWLRIFDRRSLSIVELDENPLSVTFGKPQLFKISTQKKNGGTESILVHPERILLFESQFGAGDSDTECISMLSRAYNPVRDWGYAWAAVVETLDQGAIGIWKIGHLRQLVSKEGEGILESRFGIATLGKSIARAMVVDKDNEDFEWRQLSLGGLPDTLDRVERRVSAATGIPVTKLFGMSPAGLNATGESDIRNYYDQIEAERRQYIVPELERLIGLLFLEKEGTNTQEPDNWRIEFPPLWQPTEVELRDNELKAMQTLALGVNAGLIIEKEARSAFGPNGTIQSVELDDSLFEEEQAAAEEEAETAEGQSPEGAEQ